MRKDTEGQDYSEDKPKNPADNPYESYDLERQSDFLERSKVLVPSSMELGTGGVEKYIISKQIAKMDEPRSLSKDDLIENKLDIFTKGYTTVLHNFFTPKKFCSI